MTGPLLQHSTNYNTSPILMFAKFIIFKLLQFTRARSYTSNSRKYVQTRELSHRCDRFINDKVSRRLYRTTRINRRAIVLQLSTLYRLNVLAECLTRRHTLRYGSSSIYLIRITRTRTSSSIVTDKLSNIWKLQNHRMQ